MELNQHGGDGFSNAIIHTNNVCIDYNLHLGQIPNSACCCYIKVNLFSLLIYFTLVLDFASGFSNRHNWTHEKWETRGLYLAIWRSIIPLMSVVILHCGSMCLAYSNCLLNTAVISYDRWRQAHYITLYIL